MFNTYALLELADNLHKLADLGDGRLMLIGGRKLLLEGREVIGGELDGLAAHFGLGVGVDGSSAYNGTVDM